MQLWDWILCHSHTLTKSDLRFEYLKGHTWAFSLSIIGVKNHCWIRIESGEHDTVQHICLSDAVKCFFIKPKYSKWVFQRWNKSFVDLKHHFGWKRINFCFELLHSVCINWVLRLVFRWVYVFTSHFTITDIPNLRILFPLCFLFGKSWFRQNWTIFSDTDWLDRLFYQIATFHTVSLHVYEKHTFVLWICQLPKCYLIHENVM